MLTITRRLEFDAGHRIPDHASKCRNMHGHRYVLEITLEGEPIHAPGRPEHGMLVDFADVKRLAQELVVDRWDHAFLVSRDDHEVLDFLLGLDWHKTVVLDRVPTVENLTQLAFDGLQREYRKRFGANLTLARVRLAETPNCWAECSAAGLTTSQPRTERASITAA